MQSPGGRRRAQAHDGVDRRVRRRRRRRRAPRLDDGRTALLHGGDEVAVQPVGVGDDLGGRLAADQGVVEVGELGGGVVAPDRHVGDVAHGHAGLAGQLRLGPVLVEAGHGEPAVGRDLGRVGPGDEAVRVAGVADHEDAHVGRGVRRDGLALRLEDAAVDAEQVAALHARLAGHRAHEQRPRRPVEGGLEVRRGARCRAAGGRRSRRAPWTTPSSAFIAGSISSRRSTIGWSSPSSWPEAMRKSSE